jgi:pyruvate,water dikinase
MTFHVELSRAGSSGKELVGGKALALSRLGGEGIRVPGGICILTTAYRRYLEVDGLKERILLEVERKDHDQMRWEEMWDAALRIRNLFLKTPLPPELGEELGSFLKERFAERPVVVRSSSTVEDSLESSHAGLHDSFLNIRGAGEILRHIRMVWASLWSDASLLLAGETGLEIRRDAMAVVVQELVNGEVSGITFTVDPMDQGRGVIESVHGLNKGLVDGDVEPDRWFLDREEGRILSHDAPVRDLRVGLAQRGTALASTGEMAGRPPLSDARVKEVWAAAMAIEGIFQAPQDVEWTFRGDDLYILQSRPITALEPEKPERGSRQWNLTLKGSFGRLQELRERIEGVHFPGMERDAAAMAAMDLAAMEDADLAAEIRRREEIHRHWTDVYWDEFIPMAHGVRLFGQLYNDTVAPEDPFQFVELLRGTGIFSAARSLRLQQLAGAIRKDPGLAASLGEGVVPPGNSSFAHLLDQFMEENGDLTWSGSRLSANLRPFLGFLLNLASSPAGEVAAPAGEPGPEKLEEAFLGLYLGGDRQEAGRILDLARASWRLRDDDNVYLGRIEGRLRAAVEKGLSRLEARGTGLASSSSPEDVASALEGVQAHPGAVSGEEAQTAEAVRARQLVGQPACAGLASGKARIVKGFEDLSAFQAGEVLVCDAIDPNMTLIVLLASAIVERRGGMLIHGAIIARETGIPCVNGVPEATSVIRTGDTVTVDGYLGLVIVH